MEICQTVSYENGNAFAWGTEAEYCGEELISIKAFTPVNGVTTVWSVRHIYNADFMSILRLSTLPV